MIHYNVQNWYWNVTGFTKVWSGAFLKFVDRGDGDFTTWATENSPTSIGDTADLMQVMVQQVQPLVMIEGVVLETPAELAGPYAITAEAYAMMTALATSLAAGRPLPGGGASFNYSDMTGSQHSFTADQFLSLAHACDTYIYDWTQALATNLAGKNTAYPSKTISL